MSSLSRTCECRVVRAQNAHSRLTNARSLSAAGGSARCDLSATCTTQRATHKRAKCNAQNAACNVQHTTRSMQTRNMQRAKCSMQRAARNAQHANAQHTTLSSAGTGGGARCGRIASLVGARRSGHAVPRYSAVAADRRTHVHSLLPAARAASNGCRRTCRCARTARPSSCRTSTTCTLRATARCMRRSKRSAAVCRCAGDSLGVRACGGRIGAPASVQARMCGACE